MDWLAPHFTADQLADADVCLYEVHRHLAADPVLKGIFRQQILSLAFMPPDLGMLPALVVTPLTTTETPAAGVRISEFSLFVAVRFVYPRNVSLAGGKAGLPTLFRHIRSVLSAPNSRRLQVRHGNDTRELVRRFEPSAGVSYQPLPLRQNPDGTLPDPVFDAVQRFDLEAILDPTTRQIWNLAVNAGG